MKGSKHSKEKQKNAVIIGAGPAGLTAAYELLKNTDVKPIVIEVSDYIGGLSKTIDYKGNKIDIGGHRFFSKSDKVMDWWLQFLPLEPNNGKKTFSLKYKGQSRTLTPEDSIKSNIDDVMLIRSRKSRIFHDGKFFDYPISLSIDTLKKLGLKKVSKIGFSYCVTKVTPKKSEDNLENFLINRFGKELYTTFFKDYTEKVWGVPCIEISPEWGSQRIKGLSVGKTIKHALRSNKNGDVGQKNTETSLIEYFLYPKYGPGHMWETVAKYVTANGGKIIMNAKVTSLTIKDKNVQSVSYKQGSKTINIECDYAFSTMPVSELISSIKGIKVPVAIKDTAKGLMYRDFITVGLLVDTKKAKQQIDDNWTYIQEPFVKVGRIQIFNNWSPHMVNDGNLLWVGMEYFVNEADKFWAKTDEQIKKFAIKEIKNLKIFDEVKIKDAVVIKEKKAYPAYFGTYNNFAEIRKFTDKIDNLYLIGRNGMHRYNNQDHSMLAAMKAVELINKNCKNKSSLWQINTEEEYQEAK